MRFHAVQQVSFNAHHARDEATDLECRGNLLAKKAPTDEAEKIPPIENLEAAKTVPRPVRNRWDEVRRVPSSDLHRIEGCLCVVETAIRDVKESEQRRSNPEIRARVQDMLGQLESQLVSLEAELKATKEHDDKERAKSLSEAIEAKRAWFAQINSSIQ